MKGHMRTEFYWHEKRKKMQVAFSWAINTSVASPSGFGWAMSPMPVSWNDWIQSWVDRSIYKRKI